MTRALVAVAWVVVAGSVALATYSATAPEGEVREPDFARTGDVFLEIEPPPLLRSESEGRLVLGEPSGQILRLRPDGTVRERPIAELPLAEEDGRLLGLLRDPEGRIFASWIDPERTIVVAEVGGGDIRPIWQGPDAGEGGTGGGLAPLPRGRVLVAVGDLGQPELIDEEGVANGKLLSFHPTGDPGQRPRLLGSGFSNPTAVAADDSGVIWVADDLPGDDPQPLIGVSTDGQTATVATFPSGAVASDLALFEDHLYACLSTGMLVRYRLEDLDGAADPEPVASDCARSVTPYVEGDLAYTSEDAVRTIRP